MHPPEQPVVAVIPAYNEEAVIGDLLNQVLEQDYSEVYVLDDASTDNTVEAVLGYGNDVKLVRGAENVGPGANRNRVIPVLGQEATIHFLDSDVRLNSKNSPTVARELGSIAEIGFVGGLVRMPNGQQNPWNYGPRLSFSQIIAGFLYSGLYQLGRRDPQAGRLLRSQLNSWSLIEQWPDQFVEPKAREVFWSGEANLVIPSKIFTNVGGFDPRLQYHEVMDLAIRLDRLGLKRRFDPSLDVTHVDYAAWENLGFTRKYQEAQLKIIAKMGLKDFFIPPRQ